MTTITNEMMGEEAKPAAQPQRVVVVDFDVSFLNLIGLMVKIVLASIPAVFIAAVLLAVFGGVIARLGR